MTVETQKDTESKVQVPDTVKGMKIRSGKLADIDNVPYFRALNYEFRGTYQAAVNDKIPVIHIEVDKICPHSVGEFLALWQYIAVYSAMLRGVNPFDQPHVETSKEISFELRKNYNRV